MIRRLALLPLVVLVLVTAGTPLAAQDTPDLWPAVRGDTVLVHLFDPPVVNHGFVVDRVGPDGEPARLTPTPVLPVRQPAYAAALLGSDLPEVMEVLETRDRNAVLRRMQRDRFTAAAVTMMFRSAARVLGRFYADTTAVPGETYEYRVTFLDA
ncbi:MAG TPA: hypothetical protein VK966_10285, partial [Longimicrobiales bacterium]|nr:hypothetical protein [Longimicrobiales bacterium]